MTATSLPPWHQRADWALGELASIDAERSGVVFLWCFTAVWNVASWLALVETWRGHAVGSTWIAPLFPVAGAGMAMLALYVSLHRRRWGASRFALGTRPGVLGGHLAGVLHVPDALADAEALEVSLDCTGPLPGDGPVRRIRPLWHYEEHVPRSRFERTGAGMRVPLEFRLPYHLPESDPRLRDRNARWVLSVRARVPGIDYSARFDVPVFRTSESRPSEDGSRTAPTDVALEPGPGQHALPTHLPRGIRVRPRSTGIEIVYGMARHPWTALFAAVAGLLFAGFTSLLWLAEGPGLVVAAFATGTALLAGATLDALVGRTVVRVAPGHLAVRSGPFGIGPTRHRERHEIERIEVVPLVRYGKWMLFAIRIEPRLAPGQRRLGRRITAGTRIPGAAHAEGLALAMRRVLGS